MSRHLLKLVLVVIFLTTLVFAQSGATSNWPQSWGGANNEEPSSIGFDPQGNVYVGGYTTSFGAGNADILLLKYSAAGSLQWARTWGTPGNDYTGEVRVSPDGFVYVAGYTFGIGAATESPILLKFNSDGTLQWQVTANIPGVLQFSALAFDTGGNIYVAGGGSEAALLKFDSNGNLLSTTTWLYSFGDSAVSLSTDSTGNMVLVANDSLTRNPLIVKFDSTGQLVWKRVWQTGGQDTTSHGGILDTGGNLYVGASHVDYCPTGVGLCNYKAALLKVDPNGTLLFAKEWGGAGLSEALAGRPSLLPDGNLVVGGQLNSGSLAGYFAEVSPAGQIQWSNMWTGGSQRGAGGNGGLSPTGVEFSTFGAASLVGYYAPTDLSSSESDLPGNLIDAPFTFDTPSAVALPATGVVGDPMGIPNIPAGGLDVVVFAYPVIIGPAPVLTTTGGQSATGPAVSPTSNQGSIAEPVSTGNGNYFYQHTDLAMSSRGLPLAFQRSYNTLDNYAGPLGANWNHAYNVVLTQSAAGIANIRFGDGHGEAFALSGTGYIPQSGVWSTLVANADGTFTYIQKNQTKYTFSSTGKVTSIADRNGNTITLTYDGSGNLTQITGTSGHNLNLTYDTSNRITQITDPIGRTVSYAYDANNNLASVTDAVGGITQYAYDSNHHVSSIVQPNGTTLLQNIYDAQGRVTSQTNGRGFTWQFAYNTPSTGITTITDPKGNKTLHTYDASMRIVQIADPLGDTTNYAYDANNDRVSVTNANAQTSNFVYDNLGNLTKVTNPLGNTVQMSYDALNDLLTLTNPKGKTTTFAYDSHGNLTSATDALGHSSTVAYDSFGEPTSSTNANGNTTSFTYDANGNLTKIVNPLSQATTLAYDGVGRLVSITDANGHSATESYDLLNRLTKSTDPLGNATQLAYDAVSNLLKRTDANNHATSYAYDAANNLVTVTDAKGNLTQYAYDSNNNRTGFTNANAKTTSYAYDAANRLISATDPLSFVTSYSYDAMSNAVAVTDAKKQVNHFSYDALNRLAGIAYADGKTVAYAYDADGNRGSMVDAHGSTTYAYDALDRLTSVTNPGGQVVGYAYDAMGNRTGLTYPDGKLLSYSFDAANRLSQVTDWLARITSYSYDAAGNLTKTAYPNGAGMGFGYDTANRLTQLVNTEKGIPALTLAYALDPAGNRTALTINGLLTDTYSYDVLNQLVGSRVGPLTWASVAWTYDAVGNRLQQVSPLGTTKYAYDAADRLLTAGTRTFTYDANGNQTAVADASIHQTRSFTYDAANRLTAATGPRNSSFAYDGDGNRITQSVGSGTYNYINDVAAGLPVVLQESGLDGNITYAYGNDLIEEVAPAFNYFYQYDGLGSVIGLSDAKGVPQAAYAYDAWGNTLLSVADSVGTKNKFHYTGEALDPGTGLYFLRARYYDPSVGRFVNKDTFTGFASGPKTLNRYAYAINNPIVLRDPSGYWFGLDDLYAAGIGAAAGVAAQYASDVESSLATGDSWTQALIPHSSVGQYVASTAKGAVAGWVGWNAGTAVLTAAAVGGLGTAAIDVGGDVLYDLASKQSVTNIDWRGAAVDLAVGAALPFASGMGNGLIRQAVEGAVGTLAGFDVAAISSIVGTSATYSVTSGQACQQ